MSNSDWVVTGDRVAAELSLDDLLLISYAVRDLRAATEEWEFETLVGADPEAADDLVNRVAAALAKLETSG